MGIASRPVAFTRSRVFPLLLGLGLLFATPECLVAGLDEYSSEYGKPDVESDAGDGVDSGTPPDSGPPPPDGGCMCGPGEECVLGVCEACTPTWTYDHKALRPGDVVLLTHHFDAAARTLYVVSSRQQGQDPRRGYLAEVHTCRGTLVAESDGPIVGGKTLPALLRAAQYGDSIFAKLQIAKDPVVVAGYARYDTKTHSFAEMLEIIPPSVPGQTQGAWAIDVGPSGKVHLWGERFSAQGLSTPLAMYSDANDVGKVCVADISTLAGGVGRAVTRSGNNLYAAVTFGATNEVRVVRFDDAACDIASCNCPIAEQSPPLALGSFPNVMAMKVVNSVLVLVGFTSKSDTNWAGYVVQYDLFAKTWGSVYTYDETPLLDGFLSLDSDGSFVYVNGFRGYVYGDPTTATSDIFKFPLPISVNASPTRIPLPSIRGAFSLDLDGDGILVSGYSADSGVDGRSARCTLDACP